MNKDLDYSLNNRWCIRIRTRHPDGDAYNGVVLDYNRKYVVIREIDDFEPDGIIVIPKKWIKSIRNGKLEKSYNAVIGHSKALGKSSGPVWLRGVNSLEEIIRHLKTKGIWPGVVVVNGNESSLYIGEITEADKDSYNINCYDAEGEWEKVYRLQYDSIFKIEIDSRYVRHFNNYMRKVV